ncbi:copper amine oxidase N-terminal domain-containing protein [Heliorestis convoluta]|uniref:Copper amine oxidase N-terminal domain-containing protein n=1 Tax=Heliorestis convoluta TaxID=356322 RepID=A0A5Q2MXB5_9FIRM|nr:copper amine oxidase N-terminal domain-containing protein [Heliorestis convoluta]QGG47228.1 copper amine oxidase N-terminal domain-containing protein [Heliorestis convoluta]
MKKWTLTAFITSALFMGAVVAASAFSPIKIFVNGEEIQSDVAPQIVEGRTLVPVRAIAEALQADVEWDGETSTVYISTESAEAAAQAALRSQLRQDFSQWQRLSSAAFGEVLEKIDALEELTVEEQATALEEIQTMIDEEIIAQASSYRTPPRHSKVNQDFLESVFQVRSGSALLSLALEEKQNNNATAAEALMAAADDFIQQKEKANRFMNMSCMECHSPPQAQPLPLPVEVTEESSNE